MSVKNGKVQDFVGIEIQTLDTTGTVWPSRQRLLASLGVPIEDDEAFSAKPYGINWKMTAKTILMQMHHKSQTFEHINKKLVLVIQDRFLEYIKSEFSFSHIHQNARLGDSIHIHSYRMIQDSDELLKITMHSRLSTDANGIAASLGLQAEARIELAQIISVLNHKISRNTLLSII